MNITLIGTSWCAPCKAVKQRLDDASIAYDYIDGDTDEGMATAKEEGARGFPILITDGEEPRTYIGAEAVRASIQMVAANA